MIVRRSALSMLAVFAALATMPLTGCATAEDDDEDASATTTSALQAEGQAGLTDGVLAMGGSLAPTAEEAATAVAARALEKLEPAGCATATRDGSTVSFELAACTGPLGKLAVTGRLVATFSKPTTDVVHVVIEASDGASANGASFAYASTADVRFDGARRFVTYHGSSSGTTKRGKSFARTTDLTIVADVDTHCATVDGVSSGTIGRYDVDLEVRGVKGCRDACPAGGTAHANVDGPLVKNASIEVVFDGSDTARATIVRGSGKKRERAIALDCSAAEAAE